MQQVFSVYNGKKVLTRNYILQLTNTDNLTALIGGIVYLENDSFFKMLYLVHTYRKLN